MVRELQDFYAFRGGNKQNSHKPAEDWFNEFKAKQDQLLSLHDEISLSGFHESKRFASFLFLDESLKRCANGECPVKILVPSLIWALTDISLEQYVQHKAFTFYTNGRGSSWEEREAKARAWITNVFECQKKPILNQNIFKIDTNEVTNPYWNNTTFMGARKRKAYWSFMAFHPKNEPVSDYCTACGFIEQIHGNYSQYDRTNEIIKLLSNHMYMANAIDLFRVCLART